MGWFGWDRTNFAWARRMGEGSGGGGEGHGWQGETDRQDKTWVDGLGQDLGWTLSLLSLLSLPHLHTALCLLHSSALPCPPCLPALPAYTACPLHFPNLLFSVHTFYLLYVTCLHTMPSACNTTHALHAIIIYAATTTGVKTNACYCSNCSYLSAFSASCHARCAGMVLLLYLARQHSRYLYKEQRAWRFIPAMLLYKRLVRPLTSLCACRAGEHFSALFCTLPKTGALS